MLFTKITTFSNCRLCGVQLCLHRHPQELHHLCAGSESQELLRAAARGVKETISGATRVFRKQCGMPDYIGVGSMKKRGVEDHFWRNARVKGEEATCVPNFLPISV